MTQDAKLAAFFDDWALRLIQPRPHPLWLPALPGAALALLALALHRASGVPLVLVANGPGAMETCARDLAALADESGPGAILSYPPRDSARAAHGPEAEADAGERLRALTLFPSASPNLATCVQALVRAAPSPAALHKSLTTLAAGEKADRDPLLRQLLACGYTSAPEADRRGVFSVRGGIVDVWSPQCAWPCRIEFAGDTVESLRSFDPATQRSRERLETTLIFPTAAWEARWGQSPQQAPWSGLDAHLPPRALWLWLEADTHEELATIYRHNLAETAPRETVASWSDLQQSLATRPHWLHIRTGETAGEDSDAADFPADLTHLGMPGSENGAPAAPDVREAFRQSLLNQCFALLAKKRTVAFCFDTQGAADHFRQECTERMTALRPRSALRRLHLLIAAVSEGFSSEQLGLTVVAESDLYGRLSARRSAAPRRLARPSLVAGDRLGHWTDIESGELVVHAQHGVGRYLGLFEIMFQEQRQEVLTVEYAEGAKLHVPVSQAHLLSRYIGLSGRKTTLHRLGGRKWNKEREAARRAIFDMAAQLLETQARRDAHKGYAYRPDHPWQREFEASFPYRETPDQEQAIAAVKTDMESERPMDRLLCGDAGYGKTEVAIRAAFKTAMEGRQTAVLVPTTVLAQQHFDVFRERMAPYPVRVEMLSRFCSAKRQTATLAALADGSADVVIGTHALLQAGVRFKDLGLVVIDEEQRFGVRHKEWFKHMRSQVDVLTLTATPIPRTLYMSLTGARDMSLLQTPPSERLAIETIVIANTDRTVREAILRELNRNGQVFYLHNRVMTIQRARERLQRLVPEARMIVAHGQMPTHELEAAMRRFTNGEFDVLICTTIIESGLDIPSVNTILIDRADRFGIADLYQLRGRVGRARHQGYAYLLLPPGGVADGDARERIRALREHAHLGEGFKLAVRDLEIRGAGNVLGAQQSGHIAAIGFELYCQMLQRSVAALRNEPQRPIIDAEIALDFLSASPSESAAAAYLPATYIEGEKLRIRAYRNLAEAVDEEDIEDLRRSWVDRFGDPPASVQRLLKVARIRILASHQRIKRLETRDDALFATDNRGVCKRHNCFAHRKDPAPDQRLDIIADYIRGLAGKL